MIHQKTFCHLDFLFMAKNCLGISLLPITKGETGYIYGCHFLINHWINGA
jgi:hypothetical protein